MENKMDRIDAADEAEYNRVQSVLAARDVGDNAIPLAEGAHVRGKEESKAWWEKLLANKYTPLGFALLQLIGAGLQAFGSAKMVAGVANPILLGDGFATWYIGFVVGRLASVGSLAAASYQLQHNLNGTTKKDVNINNTLTLAGIPAGMSPNPFPVLLVSLWL